MNRLKTRIGFIRIRINFNSIFAIFFIPFAVSCSSEIENFSIHNELIEHSYGNEEIVDLDYDYQFPNEPYLQFHVKKTVRKRTVIRFHNETNLSFYESYVVFIDSYDKDVVISDTLASAENRAYTFIEKYNEIYIMPDSLIGIRMNTI